MNEGRPVQEYVTRELHQDTIRILLSGGRIIATCVGLGMFGLGVLLGHFM